MSAALAIWAFTAKPGTTELVRLPKDIKVSLVALDETLADQERGSVKIHLSDDEDKVTFVLANLTPGKIEAQTVDLIICDHEEVEIEVTGKNTVHLSGNYIEQPFPHDHDLDSDDEDEDGYLLQDVSSDVEMLGDEFDDDEDAGRFEEVAEETVKSATVTKPATGKRPRDSTATDGGKSEAGGSAKKQKKKKGGDATGAAVPKTDASTKAPVSGAKPSAKPDSKSAPGKPVSKAPGSAAGGPNGQGKKDKKNKNKGKN